MNHRLKQFLDAENISQSQLAETIGVAKASISHILAGRNKPGFDFLVSISEHYPTLNLEWLITAKGKMYNSVVANSLFEQNELFNAPLPKTPSLKEPAPLAPERQEESNISKQIPDARQIFDSKLNYSERKISKLMVFYDDGTYTELK